MLVCYLQVLLWLLCRYKYLILVDGNTAPSSRSTEVFFSHSAVIKQSSPLFEFFYPLLHPHIHYLPVAADFSDLVEVLEWAQNHDAYMKAMGITARAWAERHLSDSNVVAYVSQLLRRYHGLQRFTPTVDTDMLGWKVDVTDDVKNWISMETGKTCSNITTVAPAVVVVQRWCWWQCIDWPSLRPKYYSRTCMVCAQSITSWPGFRHAEDMSTTYVM